MKENDYTIDPRAGLQQTTLISGISGISRSYLPGDIVDNAYQLTQLLGRGGMGAVFSCVHLSLQKNYALKLLAADNLSNEVWSRFQLEAKALAKLNHPGIVSIHNMGIDKNQCPYYVMDLLIGNTLDQLIHKQGRLQVDQVLDIFIQVADALASAHSQGIIHRDIKPSNLMLILETGKKLPTVKIVDFGIARVQKQDLPGQSQTATGLVFGTPFYMSPEQCDGARVDERSDIYSFGCAIFEALTGKPPFVGETPFQTFMMHQTQAPPTLAKVAGGATFPEALEAAVQKMLQKNRADRYQAMSQIKHDLERIKSGKLIRAQETVAVVPEAEETSVETPSGIGSGQLKLLAIVAGLLVFSVAGLGCWLIFKPPTHSGPAAASSDSLPKPTGVTGDIAATAAAAPELQTGSGSSFGESENESNNESVGLPMAVLHRMGASQKEIDSIGIYDSLRITTDSMEYKKRMKGHIRDPIWMARKFKSGGAFHFPTDLVMGHISINGKPPVQAVGDIPVSDGDKVRLLLLTPNKPSVEILNKFYPADLVGIEVLFDDSSRAIDKLSKWTRLEEFSCFNTIIKALPDRTENWDESSLQPGDLIKIDSMKNLKVLGLCGPLSAHSIVHMTSLRRIHSLRVKRIYDITVLLQALKDYNNIDELWLVHQETTDKQLAYLVRLKNLRRLVIRRSLLTPGCLNYFKAMPALKYLRLDRNDWTAAQKADFKKQLPRITVEFEPVIDKTYWQMIPTSK
ncbi:MAG: serine/threonine protein kinase [Cyanobacteria bacterium SZAS TMP-1]|nr:serine/threonine protein kinase [Cyanobacteria bacterium SZAS TMP-1]